jgi:DNA-binding MarR family transcriptional regulator
MTRDPGGVPPRLHDVSPSARLCYLLLDAEGALPQQRIRSMTGLSEDTVRRALGELRDTDAVIERPDPTDGRRRRYVLASHLEVA